MALEMAVTLMAAFEGSWTKRGREGGRQKVIEKLATLATPKN